MDLRLGSEISVYKGDTSPLVIDLTKGKFKELAASVMEPRTLTGDQPLILAPKRFILGRTHETVALPLHEASDKSLLLA